MKHPYKETYIEFHRLHVAPAGARPVYIELFLGDEQASMKVSTEGDLLTGNHFTL